MKNNNAIGIGMLILGIICLGTGVFFATSVKDVATKPVDDVEIYSGENLPLERAPEHVEFLLESMEEVSVELDRIDEVSKKQFVSKFENKIISGGEVLSALDQYNKMTMVLIKKNESISTVGAKRINIELLNLKDTEYNISNENYIAEGGLNHVDSIKSFWDMNSEMYVSASDSYHSYLIKITETGELVGAVFVEQ